MRGRFLGFCTAPFSRLLFDGDREGGVDVADGVAAGDGVGGVDDVVEDEVKHIKLGADAHAAGFVPDEEREAKKEGETR